MGRPQRLDADGDDNEEDEVALQVTPAPKRRARTSFASRRASNALPPNTDPKDRRKTKAEVRPETRRVQSFWNASVDCTIHLLALGGNRDSEVRGSSERRDATTNRTNS